MVPALCRQIRLQVRRALQEIFPRLKDIECALVEADVRKVERIRNRRNINAIESIDKCPYGSPAIGGRIDISCDGSLGTCIRCLARHRERAGAHRVNRLILAKWQACPIRLSAAAAPTQSLPRFP